MKRRILSLLMAVLLCISGLPAIAAHAAGEMAFETKVLRFSIDPNEGAPRYSAVVEVKNTGDTAIHLGYTPFSVTDAEGKLIAMENSSAVYAQPSVVYPGESGYYFTACIELPADIDPDAAYNLVYDTDSIRPIDTEGIGDYEVINVSFPDDDYIDIIGEVVNGADTGDVDVLCICYDTDGAIVTIGGTIEELKTDHNTYFHIVNYGAWNQEGNIATYQMIARTRAY